MYDSLLYHTYPDTQEKEPTVEETGINGNYMDARTTVPPLVTFRGSAYEDVGIFQEE
jgi:hypothetical protein